MIVWLASFPRSGNTLLRTVLHKTMGLQSASGSFPKMIRNSFSSTVLHEIGVIPINESWESFYERTTKSSEVFLVKTHLPPPDGQPAIYVIRDGRKACLSYSNFHKTYTPPPYPSLRDLVLGADYYGGWSDHYENWRQRGNLILVRYEELLDPSPAILQKLASQVRFTGEIQPWNNPFDEFRRKEPGFFREGQVAWQGDPAWTQLLNAMFFRLNGALMVELGYATAKVAEEATGNLPPEWLELVDESRRLVQERKKAEAICVEKQTVIEQLMAKHERSKPVQSKHCSAIEQLMAKHEGSKPVQRKHCSAAQLTAMEERHTAILTAIRNMQLAEGSQPQASDASDAGPDAALMGMCDALTKVVREQQSALKALCRYSISYRLHKIRRRHRYPKLGILDQHDPIPLQSWGLPPEPDYTELAGHWPQICIVTPSFGQAHFIRRTMDSVLNQNYPALQYFVQDGASRDETVRILQDYTDRLTGWDSRPDSGQSQAINKGFARVQGDIMAWLNSDDTLLPGSLAYVAAYFARHPETDVVYGHRILINEKDMEIGRWILADHDDEILSWGDYVPQETMFWRRSIWEKAGGRIDESFQFAMDWDLILRFRKAGARFACLPRFLGCFRVHDAQKTLVAISDTGRIEIDRLQTRELGRIPARSDTRNAFASYMRRHTIADIRWRIQNRLGLESARSTPSRKASKPAPPPRPPSASVAPSTPDAHQGNESRNTPSIRVSYPPRMTESDGIRVTLTDRHLPGSKSHYLRFDFYPFIAPNHPTRHIAYFDLPLEGITDPTLTITLQQDGNLAVRNGHRTLTQTATWRGSLPLSGYSRITTSVEVQKSDSVHKIEEIVSSPVILVTDAPTPLEWVQLSVTELCNLSCPMCSRQHGGTFSRQHIPPDVLNAVLDAAPSFWYVGLQGLGEPMLHPDLTSIVRSFRAKLPAQGRIAVTTNGTLLDGNLAARLFDAGLNTVTFSIDGASHATYEPRRTGARFDQVCANVAEATRRAAATGRKDLWLGTNMAMDAGNVTEVPDFVRMAARLGLTAVCFFNTREYPAMRVANLDPDTLRRVTDEALALGRELGVSVRFAKPRSGALPECPFMCGVYLWLTGEVAPCHRMEPPGSPWPTRLFGNVRTTPLLDLWNSPEFRAFRRGVVRGDMPAECQDCTFTDSVLCGG